MRRSRRDDSSPPPAKTRESSASGREGPVLWVLLGGRTGDNNQLLRLANALDVPFRELRLDYNGGRLIPPALLGPSLRTLTAASRPQIHAPWPRLVLGVGYRSVPVALAIRDLSGGRSRLVRLGNPRVGPAAFDLVITTPQYPVAQSSNVVRLPVGVSTAPSLSPTAQERQWLAKLPRPHRLLLIGGDTFMWTLDPETVAAAATNIGNKPGGSVIAVSSSRSDPELLDQVAAVLEGQPHALVWGKSPRYPVLLSDADEIYVTGDSVAMISDSIATGRPVGLIDPAKTAIGHLFYGVSEIAGTRVPVRDIGHFIERVRAQGLAGTVAEPVSGNLGADPLQTAVEAIRALL